MNYLTIDLYQDFECIADACPNTCCAGWRIDIDKETYQKMVENQDLLGVTADDWLIKIEEGYIAKKNNERCCMLNDNNLCNVVLKLGPEYLSHTCTWYPRIVSQFGSVAEGNLAVSCPEVISMLMEKESIQFDFIEDDTSAPAYSYTKLYLYESAVRTRMIDIMQLNADITLGTRLFVAYNILDKAISLYQQNRLDHHILEKETEVYFREDILASLNKNLDGVIQESHRYHFLKQLAGAAANIFTNKYFMEMLRQTNEYFNRNDMAQYLEDMQNFKICIADYANFYCNYWICRMFTELIAVPDYEKAKKNFMDTVAEFCLYQTMALVFYANNGSLDKAEYINIISRVCRAVAHSANIRERLISQINEKDAVSAAGVLFMIISP